MVLFVLLTAAFFHRRRLWWWPCDTVKEICLCAHAEKENPLSWLTDLHFALTIQRYLLPSSLLLKCQKWQRHCCVVCLLWSILSNSAGWRRAAREQICLWSLMGAHSSVSDRPPCPLIFPSSVITSTEEWAYFKALTKTPTRLEENMFHTEEGDPGPRVYLRPKESVHIPLKYQSFRCDHTAALQVECWGCRDRRSRRWQLITFKDPILYPYIFLLSSSRAVLHGQKKSAASPADSMFSPLFAASG